MERFALAIARDSPYPLLPIRHRSSAKPLRDLVPDGDQTYLKDGLPAGPKAGNANTHAKATTIMAEMKKAEPVKKKTSIPEFVNQVRTETSKVVWPTREETVRTAIFVFIFMVILSLFFFGIDAAFNAIVNFLLTLA